MRSHAQRFIGGDADSYAFLLTDGAPNCNATAGCGAETCTPNLEGGCGFDDPTINCCDPSLGLYDFRWCLDAQPTIDAVQYLADHGVQTFVIGMPGTDAYAQLLGRLAVGVHLPLDLVGGWCIGFLAGVAACRIVMTVLPSPRDEPDDPDEPVDDDE